MKVGVGQNIIFPSTKIINFLSKKKEECELLFAPKWTNRLIERGSSSYENVLKTNHFWNSAIYLQLQLRAYVFY